MEEVDSGLKIPANLPLTIVDFIFVGIKVVMVEDVDFGIKRLCTITFSIVEKMLMVMREVDICLIPGTIHPII